MKKFTCFVLSLFIIISAMPQFIFAEESEQDPTIIMFDDMNDSSKTESFDNLMFHLKNFRLAETAFPGHSTADLPPYSTNIARRPSGTNSAKSASLTYSIGDVNIDTTEIIFDAFYNYSTGYAGVSGDATPMEYLDATLKYLTLKLYVSPDGKNFKEFSDVTIDKQPGPICDITSHYVKYSAKNLPADTKFFKIEIPSIENVSGITLNSSDPAINSVTIKDTSAVSKPKVVPLHLANVYMNNMVLQAEKPVVISGHESNGKTVTATLSDGKNTFTATSVADENNTFKITFKDKFAPSYTSYTLTVSDDKDTFTYSNILFGDVFLLAGQSNMHLNMSTLLSTEQGDKQKEIQSDIDNALNPYIRVITLTTVSSKEPSEDAAIEKSWRATTKSNVNDISAVGYYFARELQKQQDYPIGLISTAWSGSQISPWLVGGEIFNTHIYPFIDFNIKGCIWYQGESDNELYNEYTIKQIQLIDTLRNMYGEDLPFCMTQLANYVDPGHGFHFVREQQLQTFKYYEGIAKEKGVQNKVGLISIIDQLVSNPNNIHPEGKKELGFRYLKWANAVIYGKGNEYSGPVVKYAVKNGSNIEIAFDHTDNGISAKDGGSIINCFQIVDDKGVEHDVTGTIGGKDKIIINLGSLNAASVQYAYKDYNSGANLMNSAGLSAPAFAPVKIQSGAIYNVKYKDALNNDSNCIIPGGSISDVSIVNYDKKSGALIVAVYDYNMKLIAAKVIPVSAEDFVDGLATVNVGFQFPNSINIEGAMSLSFAESDEE